MSRIFCGSAELRGSQIEIHTDKKNSREPTEKKNVFEPALKKKIQLAPGRQLVRLGGPIHSVLLQASHLPPTSIMVRTDSIRIESIVIRRNNPNGEHGDEKVRMKIGLRKNQATWPVMRLGSQESLCIVEKMSNSDGNARE